MNSIFKIILSFISIIIFCEYLIYILVLLNCKWPTLSKHHLDPYVPLNNEKPLRVMLIADTHLLGNRHGHWFDKIRREWQMRRSFQTALFIHNPDVVFILGDIFDEGKWATNDEFEEYVKNYHSIFAHDSSTVVKFLAGNHDIGFHYDIDKNKYIRFRNEFKSSTVDLWTTNGIHFVLLNSMAFEGDKCFLCSEAERKINKISAALSCISGSNLEKKANCESILEKIDLKHGEYSKPVVLQHFPFYRKNDDICKEDVDSASHNSKIYEFRPKWDCLSEDASNKILKKLEPRLIFSGHTHYSCRVDHKQDKNTIIPEYNVASFSWRNLNSPSFLLMKISINDFEISKCYLPQESTIIKLYAISIPFIIILFSRKWLWSVFSRIILRDNQKIL